MSVVYLKHIFSILKLTIALTEQHPFHHICNIWTVLATEQIVMNNEYPWGNCTKRYISFKFTDPRVNSIYMIILLVRLDNITYN